MRYAAASEVNMPGLIRQAAACVGSPAVAGKNVFKGMAFGQRRIDVLMTDQGKKQPSGRQLPVFLSKSLAGGHVRGNGPGFFPSSGNSAGLAF